MSSSPSEILLPNRPADLPSPAAVAYGERPAVFATLRNTSIGYHRGNGETNIARATRRANRRSTDLIEAVTRSNPTTQ
jgi:hypothetical protein